MLELSWNPDVAAWSAIIDAAPFDDLEVIVATDGAADPPTPRQLEAVALLEQFQQSHIEQLQALAEQWAEENLDEDDLADMEDEDLEYVVHTVLIPRLRESEHLYLVFAGGTEIEPEHGLGCLCKNGNEFMICHPDYAYSPSPDWDDTAPFEALLNGV